MKQNKIFIALLALAIGVTACTPEEKNYDASGAFEANEIIISAQASGLLQTFSLEEGQELKAGQEIGLVDTFPLYLKKKQLLAQIKSIGTRSPNIDLQTGFFDEQTIVVNTQLANLKKEQQRLESLVAANAAPKKQLDDLNSKYIEVEKQLEVIKRQKAAQVSALSTQKNSLGSEPMQFFVQIEQINDQLQRCHIINPINGTVLTKYAEPNEMTAAGKPLYKIADLSTMTLKAYITGNQLPNIKLNQQVTVLTDNGQGGFNETTGEIYWINEKAEFTPKTIQTKDERANLVYAIKIRVKNDGRYKIGMYGELKL